MNRLTRRPAARTTAALAALVALIASLATAGVAVASTSTITAQDCAQGTIKDQSGQTISKARCEQLVGKQVKLANTGFDVLPLLLVGSGLIAGGAMLVVRRRAEAL
jgi:LPXTG-motif cell wall-anchored protein